MVKSTRGALQLPLLEAVTLIFSAMGVSLPAHHEQNVALGNSTTSGASVPSTDIKTRLRGQAQTVETGIKKAVETVEEAVASLFETNTSTVDQEDGVSSDLGGLRDIEQNLPEGDTKDSQALEDEVSGLFKMANLRTSMTKEQFEATPMGGSVKKISHLIEKVMMPKVTEAHEANQGELDKLAKDVSKCGSTKNEQVSKADLKKTLYLKVSPLHSTCRAGEAGQFSEKESCWEEEADKKKIKDLKCKTFAMVSKQLGDQQASKQIMMKGGSESTESYVNRMSATVCGQCVGKGCSLNKFASAAKCGYEPYMCGCGFKCKFDKARDDCQKATEEWQSHHKKCQMQTAQYLSKQTQCDSLQDQMDDASCKRAVEMKDACESYAECYIDKKRAYQSLEKMVKKEEKDRKAEWRGLKRMKCLVEAFDGGRVTNSEVDACKRKTHSTDHLSIKYPKLDALGKCEVPHHYPNTPAYKADNFAPLPALAKGKQDAYQCTGIQEISTTPATGSPKACKCTRVTLNGPYSPGPMVKCENCLDVRRSLEKNSCPDGTKLFSPRSLQDWKTFLASSYPLRAPNFIIDITRPQNGCGGCKSPMNSENPKQKSWITADNSAWWLSSKPNSEPNGNYYANCYLNLKQFKQTGSGEPEVVYDDANCNFHSKSYFCQAADVDLTPKPGSPDSCVCSLVSLNGKYSAGSLIKCTGCIRVSRSLEKNSCPSGTKIFSPRTREDWKTFIASAAPLRSPDWIIDVTQAQKGCGGCTKSAMNSRSPPQATWRTSDNTPWFLRSSKYTEPNGDYAANCYMRLNTAVSEDSVTFNDHDCKYNSDAYYCQPAKMKKKPVPLDPPAPPPPPPPPAKPPVPKAGGKYTGFKCAGGSYTGAHSKCGHFTGLSESECWAKCEKSASAQDDDDCDKKTGVPECVASVYDKAKKTCILHRRCTKLTPWEGHPKIQTRIKSTYNPAATIWKVIQKRACKGDPYTRPKDEKKGLKRVTEDECKAACFNNQGTGSKSVPLERCSAFTFYSKTGYCDFFTTCLKTKKKSSATTYVKLLVDQTAKTKASKRKKGDEDEEDEEDDEDEEDEED